MQSWTALAERLRHNYHRECAAPDAHEGGQLWYAIFLESEALFDAILKIEPSGLAGLRAKATALKWSLNGEKPDVEHFWHVFGGPGDIVAEQIFDFLLFDERWRL
jgi:hypothetical protein